MSRIIIALCLIWFSWLPSAEAESIKDEENYMYTVYELNKLNNAILEYQSIHKQHKLPPSLIQLVRNPAITAETAIDNRNHGPFMVTKITEEDIQSRMLPFLSTPDKRELIKNNEFIDAWGKPLQYTINEDGTFIVKSTTEFLDIKEITKDTNLDTKMAICFPLLVLEVLLAIMISSIFAVIALELL